MVAHLKRTRLARGGLQHAELTNYEPHTKGKFKHSNALFAFEISYRQQKLKLCIALTLLHCHELKAISSNAKYQIASYLVS